MAGLRYGTGGFRGRVDTVRPVFEACGAIACLRSQALGGAATGVMVTASHNPEEDNGVKIVERDGRMLDEAWEGRCERVANAPDPAIALGELRDEVLGGLARTSGSVYVGRDTRGSSPELAALVARGAKSWGAEVVDLGVVTTPELHWAVRQKNLAGAHEGYRESLAAALRETGASAVSVDCANGVGALTLGAVLGAAPKTAVRLFNTGQGALNRGCGADYVQKSVAPPDRHVPAARSASMDGDADRLIYYSVDAGGRFELVDGDKILAFVVGHLARLFQGTGLSVGAAYTSYTNGACLEHLGQLASVQLVRTSTGVKHLEREARKLDVGAYWEPNGHGTVLFSERARRVLSTKPDGVALLIANQAVGDALANLLMLEALMAREDDGFAALYGVFTAFPSCNRVVRVADKSVFRTTLADESRLSEPKGLQDQIDRWVAERAPLTRGFVRPSGTEDVVRVYTESPVSLAEASGLADQLVRGILDFSGRQS